MSLQTYQHKQLHIRFPIVVLPRFSVMRISSNFSSGPFFSRPVCHSVLQPIKYICEAKRRLASLAGAPFTHCSCDNSCWARQSLFSDVTSPWQRRPVSV